ncbi:hypothetical protein HPP92_005670 [Vanilla planifolia]|uniref:3'(2'),5'-bisphosphate nucleotidase n=1 Tax=Vanilla planifolia TaxID=51239 RepID=A0A835RUX6_VANPL|nr:hypothetical protein HPP92_005670 [Vanilla planifolia]
MGRPPLDSGLSRLVALVPSTSSSASKPSSLRRSGVTFCQRFYVSAPSLHFRCVPLRSFTPSRGLSAKSLGGTFSAAMSSSSSSSYEKEFAAAKKAVSLASHLCQKVQRSIIECDVQSKADKSPVTVADYGSQALVSLVLRLELPSQPFSLVAEEDSRDLREEGSQGTLRRITNLVNDTLSFDGTYNVTLSEDDVLDAIDRGKSEGGPNGQHWVLDPIDGTKGFLRGDQYAIALAMLDKRKVVLGVLACPNLPQTSISSTNKHSSVSEIGCLFSARLGYGTVMQYLDGSKPSEVHVSTVADPANASLFESFEAAHSMHDLSSTIAEKLGVKAPPVRIDSQAKYCALARGDGAIYLRFPHEGYREKIWDHAAGSIVVSEAGGVVTDAAGKELDFSKGRYLDLNTGIICTNKKLMPQLLKAVQDSLKGNLQTPESL